MKPRHWIAVLACALAMGASGAASARDTPLRVSEYRMTSPDVVAPVVRVAEVVLTSDADDDSVLVRGTTENGQPCGAWRGPAFDAAARNVVCDYGALVGWTDAGGALLVTTEVQTAEGLAVNDVLLDVGLLSCVSGCSGRTRSYDVPLSTFIRPHRIGSVKDLSSHMPDGS